MERYERDGMHQPKPSYGCDQVLAFEKPMCSVVGPCPLIVPRCALVFVDCNKLQHVCGTCCAAALLCNSDMMHGGH